MGEPAAMEFRECDACAAKPGSPYLCTGCITNRLTIGKLMRELAKERRPIPMLIWCPGCNERHIDRGVFATKPHHTHACQYCGVVWRPAVVPTVGVEFLPGFKDETGDRDG